LGYQRLQTLFGCWIKTVHAFVELQLPFDPQSFRGLGMAQLASPTVQPFYAAMINIQRPPEILGSDRTILRRFLREVA
jgi:hypothetical protein